LQLAANAAAAARSVQLLEARIEAQRAGAAAAADATREKQAADAAAAAAAANAAANATDTAAAAAATEAANAAAAAAAREKELADAAAAAAASAASDAYAASRPGAAYNYLLLKCAPNQINVFDKCYSCPDPSVLLTNNNGTRILVPTMMELCPPGGVCTDMNTKAAVDLFTTKNNNSSIIKCRYNPTTITDSNNKISNTCIMGTYDKNTKMCTYNIDIKKNVLS